ncbi:hypothetical protein ACSBR2_030611 [Camellia fascicularis]
MASRTLFGFGNFFLIVILLLAFDVLATRELLEHSTISVTNKIVRELVDEPHSKDYPWNHGYSLPATAKSSTLAP